MSTFTHARRDFSTRSRLSEAVAEVSLTAAAAAFTAAVWLSVGASAIAPAGTVEAAGAGARHVTLPTVTIVGRRDSLEGTPVATTAQNTAANPISLPQ